MSALENKKKWNTKWVLKSWIVPSYGLGWLAIVTLWNHAHKISLFQKNTFKKANWANSVTASQNSNVRFGQFIANQDWKNWCMSVKLIWNSGTNSNLITKYENCRNYILEVKSSLGHKLVKSWQHWFRKSVIKYLITDLRWMLRG